MRDSATVQDRALEVIGQMPKTATIEEIIEKLTFVKDVDEGFLQIENGEYLEHSEIEKRMAKWLGK